MLRKGTVVARISAANVIPPMLAPSAETYQDIPDLHGGNREYDAESRYVPEMMENIPPKLEPTPEQLDSLFEKLDLTGISEWPEYEQNGVCELIQEYKHLFALGDLECTSQVKHKINLNDTKPFKELYQRIPPQQFEEVRAHLRETLKI